MSWFPPGSESEIRGYKEAASVFSKPQENFARQHESGKSLLYTAMALGIDLTSIYVGLKELKHAVCTVTKQLKPKNSFCHKACVLTAIWI